MSPEEIDLARLLWPIEPAAFFRDHWEQKPLHIARRDAEHYRGLFSLRDVDSVIAFTRPKFTQPGDFKPAGGKARSFVQGILPDDNDTPSEVYPDVSEVHRTFAQGKTLILTAMQQRWPAVAALSRVARRLPSSS